MKRKLLLPVFFGVSMFFAASCNNNNNDKYPVYSDEAILADNISLIMQRALFNVFGYVETKDMIIANGGDAGVEVSIDASGPTGWTHDFRSDETQKIFSGSISVNFSGPINAEGTKKTIDCSKLVVFGSLKLFGTVIIENVSRSLSESKFSSKIMTSGFAWGKIGPEVSLDGFYGINCTYDKAFSIVSAIVTEGQARGDHAKYGSYSQTVVSQLVCASDIPFSLGEISYKCPSLGDGLPIIVKYSEKNWTVMTKGKVETYSYFF